MYRGKVFIDPYASTDEVGGRSCTRLNNTMHRPTLCKKLAIEEANARCFRPRIKDRRMKNGKRASR